MGASGYLSQKEQVHAACRTLAGRVRGSTLGEGEGHGFHTTTRLIAAAQAEGSSKSRTVAEAGKQAAAFDHEAAPLAEGRQTGARKLLASLVPNRTSCATRRTVVSIPYGTNRGHGARARSEKANG